jgi:hypothetical protein
MVLHGDDATPAPGPFLAVNVEHRAGREGNAAAAEGEEDDALGFGAAAGSAGGRGGAMCSVLARAGILPKLVSTLASLNTAANEEAGIGPGGPGVGGSSPAPAAVKAAVSVSAKVGPYKLNSVNP